MIDIFRFMVLLIQIIYIRIEDNLEIGSFIEGEREGFFRLYQVIDKSCFVKICFVEVYVVLEFRSLGQIWMFDFEFLELGIE